MNRGIILYLIKRDWISSRETSIENLEQGYMLFHSVSLFCRWSLLWIGMEQDEQEADCGNRVFWNPPHVVPDNQVDAWQLPHVSLLQSRANGSLSASRSVKNKALLQTICTINLRTILNETNALCYICAKIIWESSRATWLSG